LHLDPFSAAVDHVDNSPSSIESGAGLYTMNGPFGDALFSGVIVLHDDHQSAHIDGHDIDKGNPDYPFRDQLPPQLTPISRS
jgi:hypothetical protein